MLSTTAPENVMEVGGTDWAGLAAGWNEIIKKSCPFRLPRYPRPWCLVHVQSFFGQQNARNDIPCSSWIDDQLCTNIWLRSSPRESQNQCWSWSREHLRSTYLRCSYIACPKMSILLGNHPESYRRVSWPVQTNGKEAGRNWWGVRQVWAYGK